MFILYNSLCARDSSGSVVKLIFGKTTITGDKDHARNQIEPFSKNVLPCKIQEDQFHLAVKKCEKDMVDHNAQMDVYML